MIIENRLDCIQEGQRDVKWMCGMSYDGQVCFNSFYSVSRTTVNEPVVPVLQLISLKRKPGQQYSCHESKHKK